MFTEDTALRALKRKKDVKISQDRNFIYRLRFDDSHIAGDIGNKANAAIDYLVKKCAMKILVLPYKEFNKVY